MTSLQHQLSKALGLGIVVFALVLWFAGTRVLEALAVELLRDQLRLDADALLAGLSFDATGTPLLPPLVPAFFRPFSGHYYVAQFADGIEYRSRSLWDEQLPVTKIAQGEERIERLRGPRDQTLLARTAGYRKARQNFVLLVAADVTPLARHSQQLGWIIGGFAVGALGVLLLIQQLVLRASLKPLSDIRNAVTALETGGIERLSEDVPQEVLPLVSEVNRLLGILAQRLTRSRHALGNLAHALKKPLHLLLDDLAREPLTPAAAVDARAQAKQIHHLVDRELKRARLAGGASGPAQRFRIPVDLDDLIATVHQLHRDRQLQIAVYASGGPTSFGEREDIQELLGNLLDNACKWANQRVSIALSGTGPLEVIVADDGPGLGTNAIATVLARGGRLDETRDGHGLGLAIARDIAAAYGGALHFATDPELGGLQVKVSLPMAVAGGA